MKYAEPFSHRFPPPWQAVEVTEGFKIIDAKGLMLARVYHGPESGLTKDEARRIAANIAKLPELLGAKFMTPGPRANIANRPTVCCAGNCRQLMFFLGLPLGHSSTRRR